ncbi:MAG: hypothetical protein PHY13_04160 [Clostridia bacterium]|nr:hypothetical protein [Clostridia bacterium]
MKKNKILIISLLIAIIISLTGCQLAIEDMQESENPDILIGAFITFEPLILFDNDSYINENIDKIMSGKDQYIDTSKYEGRLYAKLVKRTYTNEYTNEPSETSEYVFEDIEGITYIAATVSDSDGIYTVASSSDGISDTHTKVAGGNIQREISLEGTIYLSITSTNKFFYMNPVYQDTKGNVYVVTGSGYLRGVSEFEGSVFSQTLEDSKTITENGITKTQKSSIKISISYIHSPFKISIYQMDKNNSKVKYDEYIPNEVPDKISLDSDTDYIIVETHKYNDENNLVISREIHDKDEDYINTFYCMENGICSKKYVKLIWQID